MDELATYVSAILGLPSPVAIQKHERTLDSWWDQGVEVEREEAVYVFDNGAVVRWSMELDQPTSTLVCADCWIDCEVIEHPPRHRISPKRKGFDNTCRESFRLKYHSA